MVSIVQSVVILAIESPVKMVNTPFDSPPIPSSENFDKDPEVWDIIIVGCGVAGSALAYKQGMNGRRVLVLERDLSQPDRIVGELLQPGGLNKLRDLGMGECVDNIDSQKVYGYAMFKNDRVASVRYPTEYTQDAEVAGRSFHHGRFIQKLRHKVATCKNVTLRQGTVRKLIGDNDSDWEENGPIRGVRYKTGDGVERNAKANLTVVCDGLNSNLRKNFMDPKINLPSFFVGLLLRNTKLPFPNYGHVVLADPSPILFYPISSNEVRCLVDIPGQKLPSIANGEMAAYMMDIIYPQVPKELKVAFKKAVDDGEIRSMQNKQMYSEPIQTPGGLLLGDAFNMRHPLTGGGMTVALSDTNLLCSLLDTLDDFKDTKRTTVQTSRFHTLRKPISATINTLANALYEVFKADKDNQAHEEMRQACFDYLRMGGMYSQGPVSLLSGLNPKPSVLVMHFFMVALFGVSRLLSRPHPKNIAMAFMLLYTAAGIIFPIIRAEGIVPVFMPYLARTKIRDIGAGAARRSKHD